MPSPLKTKRRTGKAPAKRRSTYHHGNLREALIEASLRLIEKGGQDQVTVSEAAKLAGVSSGAPFRHFPNRTALMTAVAEVAMHRLRIGIEQAVEKTRNADPAARLRAMGRAYLHWASDNPTHFRVISDRNLIDFEGSESLMRDNEKLRALMESVLAKALGRAPQPEKFDHLLLGLRALVYGIARMHSDGHFKQWNIAGQTEQHSMQAALDLFIDGLLAENNS